MFLFGMWFYKVNFILLVEFLMSANVYPSHIVDMGYLLEMKITTNFYIFIIHPKTQLTVS